MEDLGVTDAKLPPHLIDYMGAKRCSICKMPFPRGSDEEVNVAFADHVRMNHRPSQTTEEINQAAVSIVRDATH